MPCCLEATNGATLAIDSSLDNSGNVGTLDGHIQIDGDVTNESTGQIGAGNGGTIPLGAITVTNDAGGDIGAKGHGHLRSQRRRKPRPYRAERRHRHLEYSDVENDSAPSLGGNGGITANSGGTITFDYGCVTNNGAMERKNGLRSLSNTTMSSTLPHQLDGNGIGAFDGGSIFTDSCVDNTGFIRAFTGGGDDGSAGTIYFTDSTVNNAGGTIAAIGAGSVIQLADTTIKGGTLFTDLSGLIEVVASVDGDSCSTVRRTRSRSKASCRSKRAPLSISSAPSPTTARSRSCRAIRIW